MGVQVPLVARVLSRLNTKSFHVGDLSMEREDLSTEKEPSTYIVYLLLALVKIARRCFSSYNPLDVLYHPSSISNGSQATEPTNLVMSSYTQQAALTPLQCFLSWDPLVVSFNLL